jgi:hypothetical protein
MLINETNAKKGNVKRIEDIGKLKGEDIGKLKGEDIGKLKGIVSRDFLASIFFHQTDPPTAGAVSIATISEKRPGLKLKFLLSNT